MNGEWEEAKSFYYNWYSSVAGYVADNSLLFLTTVVGSVVAIVLLLVLNDWWKHRANQLIYQYVPQRRGKMLKKARERYVDAIFADGLVAFAEDLVYRGSITRLECNERYRKLGAWLGNRDLLPSNQLLKDLINKRLKDEISYAKVHIPGGHPKDDVKVDTAYKTNGKVVSLRTTGKFGDKARRTGS